MTLLPYFFQFPKFTVNKPDHCDTFLINKNANLSTAKVSISAHFLIFETDKMADHKQFANILAGVASAAKQITHIIAVDVFLVHL